MKGFPHKTKTFDFLGDAKDWARQVESDMKATMFGSRSNPKYTVRQLIERYMEQVLISKSNKPRYIENQRLQLLWWIKHIGNLAIAECNQYVLGDAMLKLSGVNYCLRKKGTVNRYLACLSHVFSVAIKQWGWATINPVSLLDKPKEPRGRVRFLTAEELQRLFDVCKAESRKPLHLIVMFALTTAARKGEIFNLKIKDLDLAGKVAVVYETKNSEPRQLFLTDDLVGLLKEWLPQRNPRSEYVFAARFSLNPVNIDVEWKAALKRAGIKDFRFHDLRHTAASYYAMNGVSQMELSEILGHKSLNMVKRYSHLSRTHTAQVVQRVGQVMFNNQQQQVTI